MVTQTDKAVIVACATMLLAFWIDTRLNSVWTLYVSVLITAGLFGYGIWKESEPSGYLRQSTIFGVVAALTYIPLDWGLSQKIQFVLYLRSDLPVMPSAPLSLVLTWMIAITAVIYLYHRSNSISVNIFISAGVTGTFAFVSSTILDQFGTANFLWLWNCTPLDGKYTVDFPRIGSTPVFVPIALLLTFLLSPYYFYKRQHAIVAGIRCGLFMGTILFCCFAAFLVFCRSTGV